MTRLALGLALLCAAGSTLAGECRSLFDGETLEGWQPLGNAEYEARDGAIIGRAVSAPGNSFLHTVEEFGDFTLKLKFRFDPNMQNSGVQFRSDTYDEPTDVVIQSGSGEVQNRTMEQGRVYGYQSEIDPSDRGWTAEIYDEAARGWLKTFSKTPKKKLISPDTWYALKIRAHEDHIQTWIDGEQIADLKDDERSSGFIALQVHGIKNESQVGAEIAFKDIRICVVD
jgi:hypothetical protein